ncbi:MAG: 2-C-methyl-D-erythritol 4-phosphate cytidylyltransferase, partial [Bacteroidia bacterium]
ASKKGNAIPVIPVKDSIRRITADENKSVDRDQYFIVQTPQVFRAMPLINAFENNKLASFTDEASLMEQSGVEISTVPGEITNIKITFPEDLSYAQSVLRTK